MEQKTKNYQSDQGWTQYEKLVLSELERLNAETKCIQESINQVHIDIASFKIKSGLWGAIAGSLAVIAGALLKAWAK